MVRKDRWLCAFFFCLVWSQSLVAVGQLSLDRPSFAGLSATDRMMTQLDLPRGGASDLANGVPDDYFEADEGQGTKRLTESTSSQDESAQVRRLINFLVLGGLSLTFCAGVAITVTTIRRQSTAAAPKRIF